MSALRNPARFRLRKPIGFAKLVIGPATSGRTVGSPHPTIGLIEIHDLVSSCQAYHLCGATAVSGLLQAPEDARALYVLAHGAGAGMTHPFMAAVAAGLASRGIASLRYQFPSMERGGKRPDPPAVAQATVRAAVATAAKLLPTLPLIAGGKSFGGRMTSQAQAKDPLPAVRGLVFLGFPLHPAGKPSQDRGKHLFAVRIPMLFLQGSRDMLAALDQIEPLVRALGAGATLTLLQDADHSFHVPARSGRRDADVRGEMLDALAGWIDAVIKAPAPAR